MAVERPERGSVSVNVDTIGATSRQMRSLEGLTDWAGVDNANLCIGACGAFPQAEGLTKRATDALKSAWREVKAIDRMTGHFTDALGLAAKHYGETDRHSGDAVARAASGMRTLPTPEGK